MTDPTDPISSSSGITPNKGVPGSEDQSISHAGQKPFSDYMEPQEQPPSAPKGATQEAGTSPLDLATQGQPLTPGTPPTLDTIQTQISSNSSLLGDLQQGLANNKDKLKFKPTDKYRLRNQLNASNEKIRTAAEKAGVEPGPPPNWATKKSPVDKFLALVGDSQVQLQNTQKMITHLRDKNGMISPGNLLLIQTKLAKAQQELEYSSVLLTKAVDGVKQMFNIQI